MAYVDGFVFAVPTANKEAFRKYAESFVPLFHEYGVERVVECWGMDTPEGEVTSFPMAVKCKPDETVCFSWLWWPDRATRDTAMEKMMQDERFDPANNPMPFDGKRIIVGSFEPIVDG